MSVHLDTESGAVPIQKGRRGAANRVSSDAYLKQLGSFGDPGRDPRGGIVRVSPISQS
jgi:hypothetical protein